MRHTENGFSLIELMIAVGILGIMVQQYASYATQREQQARYQAAQHDSKQLQSTLLTKLRKELQSRPVGSTTEVIGQQLDFTQETAQGEFYQVKVINRCQPFSSGTPVQVRNPSDQECYQSLGCQGLPYVEWSRGIAGQAGEVQRLPAAESQTRNLHKKFGVVGLGLCFRKQSDRLEAYALAFVQSQDAEGHRFLRIEGLGGQMPLESRNSIQFLR